MFTSIQKIPVKYFFQTYGEAFALLQSNGRTPTEFNGARICTQEAPSHPSHTNTVLSTSLVGVGIK